VAERLDESSWRVGGYFNLDIGFLLRELVEFGRQFVEKAIPSKWDTKVPFALQEP